MVQEIKTRVAGTWELVTDVETKVSGDWKDVLQVQTRVSGVWQTVFLKEIFALTGSSGSPNTADDFAIAPGSVIAGFQFRVDGSVWRQHNGSLTQWQAGVEYTNFQPDAGADTWIRATLNNGTPPTTGNALNVWAKVRGSGAVLHQWMWDRDTIGQFLFDSVKVELSSDSSGSPVIATGYYGIDEVAIEP